MIIHDLGRLATGVYLFLHDMHRLSFVSYRFLPNSIYHLIHLYIIADDALYWAKDIDVTDVFHHLGARLSDRLEVELGNGV